MFPGTGELIVIFVLVLLLFGPDKLPELARTIGRGIRELRKATNEFRSHLNFDDDDDEWRRQK
ncbi:MAG: twin-arginine translocase TatA/TatE family subunit [Armatimonadota bacterium]|nr:twin-arginine translocase TatA/TatE family subunit [Armatimonadota bacterium]